MRAIKFRAWHKPSHKMSSPDLISPSGDCWNWSENYTGEMDYVTHEYELMQFTGLLDKNGKEIYESDVVSQYDWVGKENYSTIQWNQARCGFYLYKNDEPHLELADYRSIVVIGNLYENPEYCKGIAK